MGYYTYFDVRAAGYNHPMTEAEANAIEECFVELFGGKEWSYKEEGKSGWFFNTDFEAKWYDCESDMKEISLKFPDVLFEVWGDGEETDDLWLHYWLNGKYQDDGRVVIINQFDKSKLIEYNV